LATIGGTVSLMGFTVFVTLLAVAGLSGLLP
jgi:hypothetical protein